MSDGNKVTKNADGSYSYRGFRVENRAHRHTIGGEPCWVLGRRGTRFGVHATRRDALEAVDAYWTKLGK